MESDRYFLGLIRCILWCGRQHEQICRRGNGGLLEHATLVGDVPDVPVARVNLVAGRRNRNLVSFGVGDRVFAAADVPFAPWCYDGQIRSERGVSELETDLIVPLAGATVSERIRAHLPRDFNLSAGDEGTAH